MNPTPEPTTKYYGGSESAGIWSAMAVCFAVIAGGSSIAAHSWVLTSGLLLATAVVWFVGFWILSRTRYFVSAERAGFKDAFRSREVEFDEVKSVTKCIDRYSQTLIFTCKSGTVSMPLDPLDDTWFSAVITELHKRGIQVSCTNFGFPGKLD